MDSSIEIPVTRIFLIGLSDALARSVARYVSADKRVVLCGVAPDLALADIMLPATQTALALVDWSALDSKPGPGLRALRTSCPGLWIACVMDDAEGYRDHAIGAGAHAVIAKESFADQIESLLVQLFGSGNQMPGRPYA